MADDNLHLTSQEARVTIAVMRAVRLLQSEPRLVSRKVLPKLTHALNVAACNPKYAEKLVGY
jgi:hypothetical protein